MRFNKEDLELVKFFDVVNESPIEPYIFHIANERRCTHIEGRNLKRKGVKRGVLDTFCIIESEDYNGLIMEFKKSGEKLTKEQSQFVENALQNNFMVQVVYSAEQALETLINYLKKTAFLSCCRDLQQALAGMRLG